MDQPGIYGDFFLILCRGPFGLTEDLKYSLHELLASLRPGAQIWKSS